MRDPLGRSVRLVTARGMLLVFREEAGGAWRGYECRRGPDLIAFLMRHRRPFVSILASRDPMMDLYLCDDWGLHGLRATVLLRPWRTPYPRASR